MPQTVLGMAAADAIILTRQRIEIVHTALEDAHGFATIS